METDPFTAALFAAARAVQYGACLLIFGVLAFDRLVVGSGPNPSEAVRTAWSRVATPLLSSAFAAALLSGVVWLGVNAINMSGLPPSEALRADVLRIVLTDTHFGKLWELRAGIGVVTLLICLPIYFRRGWPGTLVWAAVGCSGVLAATLAWAGHGLTGEPAQLHLTADAVHVLAGGLWPVGLLPFCLLLMGLRRWPEPERSASIAGLTRRFSVTSLVSVAVLLGSGIINTWVLVGTLPNLFGTPYGRVLLAKIAVFTLMLVFGAVNLMWLSPRLWAPPARELAARRLLRNVALELLLTNALMLLVGVLGLLPPAIGSMAGHHHH